MPSPRYSTIPTEPRSGRSSRTCAAVRMPCPLPTETRYGLACRIQQASDSALDFVILALAGVAEDDATVLVDDVLGRPVLIAPGVPGRRIVVLRYRVGDTMPLQRGLHIAGRPFERKFRRVDADDDEPLVLVALVELGHLGQRVDAVVAAIGPEIDQHHLATKISD